MLGHNEAVSDKHIVCLEKLSAIQMYFIERIKAFENKLRYLVCGCSRAREVHAVYPYFLANSLNSLLIEINERVEDSVQVNTLCIWFNMS